MGGANLHPLWRARGAVSFACLLFLSACGGGGEPPAPAPPPPPPPPPVNENLTNLITDDTFDAASVVLSFDVDNSGVTSNVEAQFAAVDGGNSVIFDHGATSYTLSLSQGAVSYDQTFGPGDIDEARSDTTLRVYTVDNGAGDITDLVLLIPGDPVYGQSYVTLGMWNSVTADPGRELSFGTVVFGIRTASSDMPTMGTGTYTGLTFGQLNADNTYFQLVGDVRIDVDFNSGTVTSAFTNMVKENSVTGGLSAWRDFNATASITTGTSLFTGTTETVDTFLTGEIAGGFFGPIADEVGGAWSLSGAGETATGGFVGKR